MIEYQAIKDIGVLTEKVAQIENVLANLFTDQSDSFSTESEDSDFEDLSHRYVHPHVGKITKNLNTNNNLCRAVQASMYTVELLKSVDGIPSIISSDMTRAELDDFIAKNPGKMFSEFIVSVTPSYKEHI